MKLLRITLGLNAVLLSLATLVLPAAALGAKLENTRFLWSTPRMRELTLRLFSGPVMMLALSVLVFAMISTGRRIPWWLVLIGLLGTAFTKTLPPGISHDFSHIVFQSCSSIYGQVNSWLCIGLGACLLAVGDLKSLARFYRTWRSRTAEQEEHPERRSD